MMLCIKFDSIMLKVTEAWTAFGFSRTLFNDNVDNKIQWYVVLNLCITQEG